MIMLTEVTTEDVQLGDIISLDYMSEGYNHVTVVRIEDDRITVLRPYVHTGDFEYSGGVLRYLGFEEFTLHRTDNRMIGRILYRDKRFDRE